MKFNNKELRLGFRFYTSISEDEYNIYSLICIDEENERCKLMNEETLLLEEVSRTDLEDNYVLLTNSIDIFLVKLIPKKGVKRNPIWEEAKYFKADTLEYYADFYNTSMILDIATYPFMSRSIFYKMINYIIQEYYPKHTALDNSELAYIHSIYNRYVHDKYTILSDHGVYKDEIKKCDMTRLASEKLLPDALIDIAEELLNTCIKTYEVYEYDDSINLNNINMKHFFLEYEDKYYIVLYTIDNIRNTAKINENLQKHMDVVEFMLK